MGQIDSIYASATREHSQLMRRASIITLSGVSFLIALKLFAWWLSGSLSLLSSLVDSGMDLLASLLNFFAIRYALQPPDHEHRFGHGKVEYIAGLAQAMFISLTAFIIAVEAIRRFFLPQPVTHGAISLAVMAVSIGVTLLMIAYQRHAIRKTNSAAVRADMTHYLMDVLANAAVIVSLALSVWLGWKWADPLFALAISAYILYGAWEVGHASFQNLMDREFEDGERELIEQTVMRHPQISGMHELKTRRSGMLCFIQFHIDMHGDMRLEDAHEVADRMEGEIRRLHPTAEILIHIDPVK